MPHIGRSTARRIVEKFGKESLEVIEHQPERLAEIKGISKAKAYEIIRDLKEQLYKKEENPNQGKEQKEDSKTKPEK